MPTIGIRYLLLLNSKIKSLPLLIIFLSLNFKLIIRFRV